ncbi:MAG: type II toxin-antitoxin system HicB family antitoxin [Cyanobacteria bacterium SBLK]|nr:type II toxin-antitoxin system HicB family antitoxin [Cyanobacteria bacterium SBLK]
MFTYKGYTAELEIDPDCALICGQILDINDAIAFEGKTVEEARHDFQESVDDYLDWCKELGEEPNKPFSGKLPYRTNPETHRKIYIAAKLAGKSINSLMDEILSREVDKLIQI